MSNVRGYRVHIWRSIYHTGVFSHNAQRSIVVHADNEKWARGIVKLDGPSTTILNKDTGTYLDMGAEYIYCIDYLGRVAYETVVKYV